MGLLDRLRRRRTSATVRIPLPLQPMHRGDWYEDPLTAAFKAERRGSRVTGAGTVLDGARRLVSADIELELAEPIDEQLAVVTQVLEAQAAPRGSSISLLGRAAVPFGLCGVLALHLPRATPADVKYDHVPCTEAAMALMKRLVNHADGVFVVQTWDTDDSGTTVYISGTDLNAARAIVEPMIASDPLGAGASFKVIVP